MNDNEIFYPDRSIVEYWITILRSENNILNTRLPMTNEKWFIEVIDTLERIKIQYIKGIHSKASHLFFYLDKNHNFIDGNKRTTIVITYLFYFINGYRILSPNRFEQLVKKVAKSHGARNKDDWMRKIEKELSYISKKISNENN